ncbi:LysR substrate-binding domain-containing protein [Luteimonas sp. FCS-9]|uniref:LysR substrate-binding domain-containing protein n=1 Tax=Luteimonas sp. FCS-9 TaxID=1547516 RepID=UPI00063ECB59|nr:LysR substrate-binding domain-containing protein [Luteimonas sp. FCS-9]KLJ00612.1 CysB family transcriptional regulator [Luteimonas sp. FCS-9]
MTLTQLRSFVAIVECGHNITLAARRLHATQSGLSKQLGQLENALGFLLFTRRRRALAALTGEGRQVLVHARRLLAEAGNIQALADNLRSEAQGLLRIAATHTQARHALPPALQALKRDWPDVAVHVVPGGDAESLRLLAEHHADLAILSGTGAPPAGLVAIPLYRWGRRVLVPAGHPLAALPRPIGLRDLAAVPLVSYESSRQPTSSLQRAFAAAELTADIAVTARDGALIRAYVHAGLGVGIVDEMGADIDDGLVAPPVEDGLLPECITWVLLRRDRVLRDFGFALVQALAPHYAAVELRRLLDHDQPLPVPAPDWRRWSRASTPALAARTAVAVTE